MLLSADPLSLDSLPSPTVTFCSPCLLLFFQKQTTEMRLPAVLTALVMAACPAITVAAGPGHGEIPRSLEARTPAAEMDAEVGALASSLKTCDDCHVSPFPVFIMACPSASLSAKSVHQPANAFVSLSSQWQRAFLKRATKILAASGGSSASIVPFVTAPSCPAIDFSILDVFQLTGGKNN